MKKLLTAALAALTIAAPAAYANDADTLRLLDMIEATGTKVSFNSNRFDQTCINKQGYYAFEEKVTDLLVVCTDQVNVNDPDALWEVVAHEATHIMQACYGDETALDDSMHPSVFRTLATRAPHYAKLLDQGYGTRSARSEAEAYWMELQTPETVMEIFQHSCMKQGK